MLARQEAGCATASFVASRLGVNIYAGLQQSVLTSYEQAVRYGFLYTDVECRAKKLMASGCTCACVLIVKDQATRTMTLVAANVGDSRILLYKGGSATRLSYVGTGERRHFRITKRKTAARSSESKPLEAWS